MRTLFLMLIFFLSFGYSQAQKKPWHILLVTGGHDFDEVPFFGMFDSLENLTYRHVRQPEANALYALEEMEQYDALVFYDMWDKITEAQQESFLNLLKKGKGMVFLHHALVSYPEWDEFTQVIGGKYYVKGVERDGKVFPASTYQHDVTVPIGISDKRHVITRGLKPFRLYDEVYGGFEVLPRVHPLLVTDHPQSTRIIGWTNHYEKSRIVYLQPGHGPQAFYDHHYRTLLLRAIGWVAGK